MKQILDWVILLQAWITGAVFFMILKTLLKVRGNIWIHIFAYIVGSHIANVVIYPNDIVNIVGALLLFFPYMLVFYKGRWIERISLVLILYPMVVSINFLTENMGLHVFRWLGEYALWEGNMVRFIFNLLRLGIWVIVLWFCRSQMKDVFGMLTGKMWLVMDCICFTVFIANLVALNYLPKAALVGYPICISSIITVFGCLYLTSYIAKTVQISFRMQVLEREHKYYEDKLRDEERVRSIYHDLKNHLLILRSGESQEMIDMLDGQIADYENYYRTGNRFLDVIVRDKALIAQEKGIDFSAMVHFEAGGFMEPLDISTLFGNALDNAIEASMRLPQERRLITLKANRSHDMLLILVENNKKEAEEIQEGTSKKDKFLHGFGLSNIQKTVERYQGDCFVREERDKFVLKLIIPIP